MGNSKGGTCTDMGNSERSSVKRRARTARGGYDDGREGPGRVMDAYDLKALFAFREHIASLPREAFLSILTPMPPVTRVALLPGSFNPPTSAHLLLAERALGERFDAVVFVLARETAGKRRTGLLLEDRLLSLRSIAPRGTAVAVTSASLYCDQAEAAAAALPGAEISILVGSDKLEQIFDAAWYVDRDAALGRLFGAARLVVAPRGDGADAVTRLLEERGNGRWAGKVDVLPLHPAVGDLSSTRVRGLLTSGADPSGLMPAPVAELIAELGAFSPADPDTGADRYALRAGLLDALWQARDWAVASADLAALVRIAADPGGEGGRLREMLRTGAAGARELLAAQRTP
ncbi:MAG TPA: hypothetical protein VM841_10805 [Actinomycetota bacterium]|nr:hypothetical protein [Actinomycetota bacterium]